MKKLNFIMVLTVLLLPGYFAKAEQTQFVRAIGSDVSAQEFKTWQSLYQKHKDDAFAKRANTSRVYLNTLITERTPYLLRHAINPINWMAWSEDVFSEAKKSTKLIFLSIGYSTCHWCHVMEEESFTNPEIAMLLAERYLAIKVDREQLPEVDHHFKTILETLSGTAGWPITAILSAKGEPLFIGSYMSKNDLSALLNNIYPAWANNPKVLEANANALLQLASKEPRRQLEVNFSQMLNTKVDQIKNDSDQQYGGLGYAQKFPNEAALLLQLEYLAKHDDPVLEGLVKRQLNNMMSFGLYDHIHGGFHRYSVGRNWQQPHFEKMAYNQGLMLLVYSKAYRLFGDQRYKNILTDLNAFLYDWFYQAETGFSSAIDAVYEEKEGAYYLLPKSTFENLVNADELPLVTSYEYDQNSVGVYFSKPFDDANTELRLRLKNHTQGLPRPYVDDKVIVSWNSLIILGLLNSYELTKSAIAKSMAESALKAIQNNHRSESNEFFRASIDSIPLSTPAILEDYAFFALASIKMFDVSGEQKWLIVAAEQVNTILTKFDQKNGIYNSSIAHGKKEVVISAGSFTLSDNEIYAANAALLEVVDQLLERTGHKQWRSIKRSLLNTLESNAQVSTPNLYSLFKAISRVNRPVDSTQYFAMGNGKVQLLNEGNGCNDNKTLRLQIKDGWHINSSKPLDKDLLPTKIKFVSLNNSKQTELRASLLPRGEMYELGFSKQTLSLYTGVVDISFIVPEDFTRLRSTIELNVQACNDEMCLMPETKVFSISHCT